MRAPNSALHSPVAYSAICAVPSLAAQLLLSLATIGFNRDREYPKAICNSARRLLYMLVHTSMDRGLQGGPALLSALRRHDRSATVHSRCERAASLLSADDLKAAIETIDTIEEAERKGGRSDERK